MTGPTTAWSRSGEAVESALHAYFWRLAVLLGILLLASSITIDLRKKMWIDELYTLHMAQQAGLTEIVNATLEGCDGAPPLYAMIVHGILPWVRNEALAVRLPSTLGFCAMVFCLLAFCYRRWPAGYAVLPALLASNAALGYSTDGRSYGLVLGCTAGALLCWQAATENRRRIVTVPLLALSLMAAIALHYFAIFIVVPLFLAELVRARETRKLDFPVLTALAAGPLVLALHYPLIAAGRAFQAHYWAPAQLSVLLWVFEWNGMMMFLLPALVLVALWNMPDLLLADRSPVSRLPLTIPEWVAAVAFLLMPVAAFVFSKYTAGVFVDRYVLWMVVGGAIAIGASLCNAGRLNALVGLSMAACILVIVGAREVAELRQKPLLRESEAAYRDLARLPLDSQPVVVANHHVFMELSYYARPELRERLIYPLSIDLDLRYSNIDTGPRIFSALRHRTSLRIVDYDAVLQSNPRFILVASSKDYLPWHLVRSGFRVIPLGQSSSTLYQVEPPTKSILTSSNPVEPGEHPSHERESTEPRASASGN
jgi:hypothetical protein